MGDPQRLDHLPSGMGQPHDAVVDSPWRGDLPSSWPPGPPGKVLWRSTVTPAYQTTQSHINMARQLDEAVAVLHVREVLKADTTG
jgi:hypothetical protein